MGKENHSIEMEEKLLPAARKANSGLEEEKKNPQILLQHDYRLSLKHEEGRAFFRLQGVSTEMIILYLGQWWSVSL